VARIVEQGPDLGQGDAEGPPHEDLLRALQVGARVQPVAGLRAFAGRQQPELVVVMERPDRHPGQRADVTNRLHPDRLGPSRTAVVLGHEFDCPRRGRWHADRSAMRARLARDPERAWRSSTQPWSRPWLRPAFVLAQASSCQRRQSRNAWQVGRSLARRGLRAAWPRSWRSARFTRRAWSRPAAVLARPVNASSRGRISREPWGAFGEHRRPSRSTPACRACGVGSRAP
jgi:hypothetical protein